MKEFIIRGYKDASEYLYWNNDMGWVESDSATTFTTDELYELNFPMEAKGVTILDDAGEIAEFLTFADAFARFAPDGSEL